MGLETMVRISKATRDRLAVIKAQRRFRTLDDAIQHLLEMHEDVTGVEAAHPTH